MTKRTITGGRMYRVDDDGLTEVDRATRVPAWVICRRVADYPGGVPPADAQLRPCATCGCLIAFNPAGPYQDRPKVCAQCVGITPDPLV